MEECSPKVENSLDSILPKENEVSLSGFLNKLSAINFVKGLKASGTVSKRRWFMYSEQSCKLYYYKHKNDVEPVGVIDIACCTFLYDLDHGTDKQFAIRSNGRDYILEASSSQERQYWLQHLQLARRKYNLKLNLVTENSKGKGGILATPEDGLIQSFESQPEITDDDLLNELLTPLSRPETSKSNKRDPKFRHSISNIPLNFFKDSSPTKASSPDKSFEKSPVSPFEEVYSFDKLSRKLRQSFKLRPNKSLEFDSPLNEKSFCNSCSKLQERVSKLEQENANLKDSCEAYREALDVLQKQVGSLESQKITFENMSKVSLADEDIIGILREKDNKIVDLELGKQKLLNTVYKLTSDLRDSRIHSEKVEEKLSTVTALIQAKDKAIMSLVSHEDSENIIPNIKDALLPWPEKVSIGTQTSNSEYEEIKDLLQGYKDQNNFLNKEILDLHRLQEQSRNRESRLISESSDWEAKFYQIQSKYLLLLNDLHSPQSTNQNSEVISQLLHDLVECSGVTDLRGIRKQGKEYDEYGFCLSVPNDFDINAKASFMQKQSKTLASQAKQAPATADLERKWEDFLASTPPRELLQHQELKYHIRKGIPYQYKGKVWSLLINSHVSQYKESLPKNYYQTLLAERSTSATSNVIVKQIEIDLLRTLPDNWHYQTLGSDGIPRLRRVLLAYSRRNTEVGYCQGLNRLAAIALLFLKEEDAFWCLVYIVECLMPENFYGKSLLGSQVDQRVMKDLIGIKLPNLASHFETFGLDISLFTFNWFLCIFIDAIPPKTYLFIWDCFLYEGTKVLFRFALAILKLCEESILIKGDYLSILDYLRSVPEPVLDIKKLQEAAFRWANPLSMKYIRSRREYHRTAVEAEMEEVEAVRRRYKEEAKRKAEGGLEVPDDDDDDKWEVVGLDETLPTQQEAHDDDNCRALCRIDSSYEAAEYIHDSNANAQKMNSNEEISVQNNENLAAEVV